MKLRVHHRRDKDHHLMVEGVQQAIGMDLGGMLSGRIPLGRPIQDSEG